MLSCFVMQPFAPPLGEYYEKIYKPAIEKAGLRPVLADAKIFATVKILDQVWHGISTAKRSSVQERRLRGIGCGRRPQELDLPSHDV